MVLSTLQVSHPPNKRLILKEMATHFLRALIVTVL
jgi:hypothetical protein